MTLDKNVSQSPYREKHNLTLSAGVKTFGHGMTSIDSFTILIKNVEGTATYFQEEDAAAVITDTSIDSGGVAAIDDGFITRVEASLSSSGVDGATVGAYCREDDGGAFTDADAAALSATVNDVEILPAVPVQDDALYIGIDDINFQSIRMMVAGTDAVVTTGQSTITYEYYNGSAWVDVVGLIDGTNGLTDLSVGTTIQWTPQADWAEVAINTVTCFWIRIVENHATPTFSQVPIGSQWSLGIAALVDVHIDGTTIFTTQANRVTLFDDIGAKGSLTASSSTIAGGTFAASDSITVDVDLVATTTAPQDLTVSVYGSYSDAQATRIAEQFTVSFGANNQATVTSSAALSTSNIDLILHGLP